MFTISLRLLIIFFLFLTLAVRPPTVRQESGEAVPAPVVNPKQAAIPVGEEIVAGFLDPAEPDAIIFVIRRKDGPLIGSIGIRLFAYRLPETTGETVGRGEGSQSGVVIDEGRFTTKGSPFDLVWYTSFDAKVPVRLRWGLLGEGTMAAQVTGPTHIRVGVECYQPFVARQGQVSEGIYAGFLVHPDQHSLLGELIEGGSRSSLSVRQRYFLLRSDAQPSLAVSYQDRHLFRQGLTRRIGPGARTGEPVTSSYRQSALIFDPGREGRFAFVAMVGDQLDSIEQRSRALLRRPVADQLDELLAEEQLRTFSGSGSIGESINLVRNFLTFNRFFDPLVLVGAGEYLVTERGNGSTERESTRNGKVSEAPGALIDAETLLLAGLSAPFAPAAAVSTLRKVLSGQLTDGRLPLNSRIGDPDSSYITAGRSMIPIGSLAALKIYLATSDLELLAWAFPRLRLWNEWWLNDRGDGQPWRDGDRDGLPEWGYNEKMELGGLGRLQLSAVARRRLAFSEAGGVDNDGSDPPFNEQSSTLEQNSVALGSMLALDTECLALIASELGLSSEAEQLRQRHRRLLELINNRLWDEATANYVDRRWNGQPVRRMSPNNLLPLAAGLPDARRARQMMTGYNQLLGSPPALDRITSPISYLLYLGLRRNNFHVEAAALAQSLSDQTGNSQGLSIVRRWASIEEIFCLDPLSGLDIGSPETITESRILGLQVGNSRLDITHGPSGTTVHRDGKVELECRTAVRLRGYRRQASALSFTVVANREARLAIPGEKGRKLTVSVDGNILGSTSVGATASFRVPAGAHRVLVVR
ncbi:MAG: hypothetical protein EBZ36_00960 [Acidobacteria bacterium]|nr:hypothetical protein [Acidobacteriota bacterium]